MGRFRLGAEDENDDCVDDGQNLDFPGTHGALALRPHQTTRWNDFQTQNREQVDANFNNTQHGYRSQPVFYIVTNSPYPNAPYDEVTEEKMQGKKRRQWFCCSSLWCQIVVVGFFAIIVYYIKTEGPPGPPPETCGGTTDCYDSFETTSITTWQTYTEKHNAALAQSLRAYLIETTWHLLSWVIPIILSDVRFGLKHIKQALFKSNSRVCSFAQAPFLADNVYNMLLNTSPTASAQPHAVLPLLHNLELTVWNPPAHQSKKSLVIWASLMTPGLQVVELARKIVELTLPTCPKDELPFAVFQVPHQPPQEQKLSIPLPEEHQAMGWVNRFRRRTETWTGGGLIVVEHVDRLPPGVLFKLMELFQVEPLSTLETDDYPVGIAPYIPLLFTSEKIGRASMAQHLRLKGSVLGVARSSLVLDIQHEISEHLGSLAVLEKAEILPFWFLTRSDVEQSIPLMLRNIVSSLELGGLVLSPQALNELLSDKRIEFINWQLPTLSGSTNQLQSISISSNGIAPLMDQMHLIISKIRKHCNFTSQPGLAGSNFTLDFRPSTHQLVVVEDSCSHESCKEFCSFHF